MSELPDLDKELAKVFGILTVIFTALAALFMAVAVLLDPGAINAVLGIGIAAMVTFGLWLALRISIARRKRSQS